MKVLSCSVGCVRALAAGSLEASGDKQDSQVRSCPGLTLETDVCDAECLPGPRLCCRLEGIQEGGVADPVCCHC